MELLRLLDIKDIAAQTVCFLLLFFLLRKFAWKHILALLDERRERIAGEFRGIEELRREAEAQKQEYARKLGQIDALAQARINAAVQEAERLAQEIALNAGKESQKLIESAREQISHEIVKAREELKESLVDLAIGATEKIISEKLSRQEEEKIVADFLHEVEKMQ